MGHLHRLAGPPGARMKLAALRTSVLLSALFVVVYGASNWITSQRADVVTWYFAWERSIPFVPIFILPYLSIDLFFISAPFLCADRAELRSLARRITLAILLGGAFFLAMPLRLAVPRPQAEGWLGAVFAKFCELDQPYNLFPSLHITLLVILADLYGRRTRGVVRTLVLMWFALICVSTLLTYQHHFIDLVGGFLLAGYCFLLVDDSPQRLGVTPNPRIGLYYAGAALLLLAVGWFAGSWGWLLLWPALALGVVACGYYGLGPGIYRKRDGRIRQPARALLAPCLWGQQLSLRHYRAQCRPWDEAAPGVLIGRQLTDEEARTAINAGVTAVLDLTSEFSENAPFRSLAYRNVPILDLTAPTQAQLEDCIAFIREHSPGGKVYVHCKIGYSRSAAVVSAWLLASGQAETAAAAVRTLRAIRPPIVVRPEAMGAIELFAGEIARDHA